MERGHLATILVQRATTGVGCSARASTRNRGRNCSSCCCCQSAARGGARGVLDGRGRRYGAREGRGPSLGDRGAHQEEVGGDGSVGGAGDRRRGWRPEYYCSHGHDGGGASLVRFSGSRRFRAKKGKQREVPVLLGASGSSRARRS